MSIGARPLGPANVTPDTSTPIGSIAPVTVIKPPPDDATTEPPSIWSS